ncbi:MULTISPECIES: ribonuclease Z [Psychrobacter]|jgi:ribonuclease Z|uniref:ribonuclease Z n=1 Tax=Psychrobacter TaxID=497 RepID=UPI000C7D505B|nr:MULTISPECIES: ribonuclease Z [Psychrobacter]PKG67468.1 MBL fold metallo-hydrolase [Psychrobacter sp. Choline-02u-13]PKH48553.1 MBL fold metallo-hydrolase [Psychrobacter sp. Choline-02u-9]
MLKLTFLGTSAGVPTKQRNVTALAIECLNPHTSGVQQGSRQQNNQSKKSRPWVLIDCGEGTQQQLLRTKLSLHQLAAICITHVHGDHCYGLPGLLASAAMSGRREPLTLIAPKAIATLLDAITATTELYLPFALNFIAIEEVLAEQGDTNKVNISLSDQQQLDIDITLLSHRVASHAFGITQTISRRTLNTDKLVADGIPASALWGKLQQGEDVTTEDNRQLHSVDYVDDEVQRTRVVVAGDNDAPNLLSKAVINADLLVHEATYTHEVMMAIQARNPDYDPMHSSAHVVGTFAQKMNLKNIILTHFSARYQGFDNPDSETPNMAYIRLDAESVYKGNLWLAADFDQYMVDGAVESVSNQENRQEESRVQYIGSARSD